MNNSFVNFISYSGFVALATKWVPVRKRAERREQMGKLRVISRHFAIVYHLPARTDTLRDVLMRNTTDARDFVRGGFCGRKKVAATRLMLWHSLSAKHDGSSLSCTTTIRVVPTWPIIFTCTSHADLTARQGSRAPETKFLERNALRN